MDNVKNQYTVWQKKKKCLDLQKKFGEYGHFETNPKNNEIMANRQCVYFCVKETLEGNNYSLLEVGPGPGLFLWEFKDITDGLYGLEYSEEMIELCEDQFEKTDKEVHLTQGSCWDLPYPDSHFDVSLQCDVTRHVGGCWESLEEQIRVSRKYVVFSGPSFEKWGLTGDVEKELTTLMFGINTDIFNSRLDKMISGKKISKYYYKDRPNKKDRLKRKILVIEI